jgi:hypothetical protein
MSSFHSRVGKRKVCVSFLYFYNFSESDNVSKYFTLQAKNGGMVMVNFYSVFVQCNTTRNATVDDVIGQ